MPKLKPSNPPPISKEEFYAETRKAGEGHKPDPRLLAASDPGEMGFLLPVSHRNDITRHIFASTESLAAHCDQQPIASWSQSFTTADKPPWDRSSIQATWTSTAAFIPQRKIALRAIEMKPQKVSIVLPVSGELTEDSDIGVYASRLAPQALEYAISSAIFSGNGVGQPLGILNSPALSVVLPENDQASGTIVSQNVVKAWSTLATGSQRTAIWLAHPDAQEFFPALNSGGLKIFEPGDGEAPCGRLFGRPIVLQEVCEAPGDIGDLVLADLRQYLLGLRSPRVGLATSIHCWFDRDIRAFRFTVRIGGQPWIATPYASRVGGTYRSPFVAIAAR